MRKNHRQSLPEEPCKVLALLITASLTSALLLTATFTISPSNSFLASFTTQSTAVDYSATPVQLQAILHYATTRVVPQQSRAEIKLSLDVLNSISPCNFLVFGLGHDSLMWTSLNPRGNTIFLEEDPRWVHQILQRVPTLRAHVVKYKTRLRDADELLSTYKHEIYCKLLDLRLKGNILCKLALSTLPDEVYNNEWDVIMIDAPRGYYGEAPGRMGAIFSAAVMARVRTRPGPTHVFLHDVNRKVERIYAKEFLCMKYMVKSEGRLWHFEIPSLANRNLSNPYSYFC